MSFTSPLHLKSCNSKYLLLFLGVGSLDKLDIRMKKAVIAVTNKLRSHFFRVELRRRRRGGQCEIGDAFVDYFINNTQ